MERIGFAGISAEEAGIEPQVDVDRLTGAARVGLPLPLSDGRQSHTPQLALSYRAGDRGSAFGLGWSLQGLTGITRSTRNGIPCYDETDVYAYGGTELVPWLEQVGGAWRQRTLPAAGYTVLCYRARRESDYMRFERWIQAGTNAVHWRVREGNGNVTVLGTRAESRIADPADGERISTWLPETSFDSFGNAIAVEYVTEDHVGVDPARPAEHDRWQRVQREPQRYPKRIRYGNSVPVSPDQAFPAALEWHFELVFDYGDHGSPLQPATIADQAWPVRSDAFTTASYGFEVRTYRLCRRVLMFHRFAELGANPVLVSMLRLTFAEHPAGTTLTSVDYAGVRQDAGVQATPPIDFAYSPAQLAAAFESASATALENLPVGFSGTRTRFVDLDGDGLPGILSEVQGAWFFKRNLGRGQFASQRLLDERPVLGGSTGLQDFDNDGDLDLYATQGRLAGSFSRDRDTGRWGGFQPMQSIPHLQAPGRKVQWFDAENDGHGDLLVAALDGVSWYSGLGRKGFEGLLRRAPAAADHLRLPHSVATDPDVRLLFADMNGDGIADLVSLSNGRVEYWPGLGHGRFGAPVLMDGGPAFAAEEEFDVDRFRISDLDGTGTTDLIYIGRGEIRVWSNASGNALLEQPPLRGLPYIDDLASIEILDLFGDGTRALVWSEANARGASVRYLRLSTDLPPGLLTGIDSGRGLRTTLDYVNSSRHYLEDALNGTPWSTRLPRHTLVVERMSEIDAISNVTRTRTFRYADGHFDREDRAFRGFGLVEERDAETLAGVDGNAVTPRCTLTWFHLGDYTPHARLDARRYRSDAQQPQIAPHNHTFAANWADAEYHDSFAALVGVPVRQETYAVEPSGRRAAHPLQVTQSGYRVERIQPARGDERAAFAVHLQERLDLIYEGESSDPRVQHSVTLEVDAYGATSLAANVAYARRADVPAAVACQAEMRIEVERTRVAHQDSAQRYELSVPIEEESFELLGAPALASAAIYTPAAARNVIAPLLAAPVAHDRAGPFAGPVLRRTEWDRNYYWNANLTAVEALGVVGGLLHHEETAVFSDQFAQAFYGATRAPAGRLTALGYRLDSGHWWMPDPTQFYTPAAEYCLLARIERWDQSVTRYEYDAHSLQLVTLIDEANNRSSAIIDYEELAPWRITDPNGAVAEVRYDALGVVVAATTYGRVLDAADVVRDYGHRPLAEAALLPPPAFDDVIGDPARYLQRLGSFVCYDLFAWSATGTPNWVVQVVQESFSDDGTGAAHAPRPPQVTAAYFDGNGQQVQLKLRAEGGNAFQRAADGSIVLDGAGRPASAPALVRWLTSGHTVLTRKREALRRYEPFFSSTPRYENEAALHAARLSQMFRFDAVGRLVETYFPNGTQIRTEHFAWRQLYHDQNDTVLDSAYRALRLPLADADPEKRALRKSEPHARTPSERHFDPEGEEVLQLDQAAPGNVRRVERRLNADGEPLQLIDQLGRVAFGYVYDMTGRQLRSESLDAGWRLTLLDAANRAVQLWDGRDSVFEYEFDALDRLRRVYLTNSDGQRWLSEEYQYGDEAGVARAQSRNARGRLVRRRDSSGVTMVDRYDPAGRVLASTRQLVTDYTRAPDWTVPAAVGLDADLHRVSARFDALGRVLEKRLPDGSARSVQYRLAGGVESIRVSAGDVAWPDTLVCRDITYNERAQCERVTLGNDVQIAHEYDPETFCLRTVTATRDSGGATETLQALEYRYDAGGNVVLCTDRAQEPGGPFAPFIHGLAVSAENEYTYDSLYRLTEATGRVHQGLLEHDYRFGANPGRSHLNLNNGQAVERYRRRYRYGAGGALAAIEHLGTSRNWTTDIWTSPGSNRSLPARDLNGNPVANPESRFDANGNCQYLPHLRRVEWGVDNQISRAVLIDRTAQGQPNDAEYYVYDGDGRRIRKVLERLVAGQVVVSDTRYLEECELHRRYRAGQVEHLERRTARVMLAGRTLATLHRWERDDAGEETGNPVSTETRYTLSNVNGSAVMELNEAGAVVSYEEYLPFGGTSFIAGDQIRELSIREHHFAGRRRDEATSLYRFEFRYYACWIGNWLSPDPLGPEDGLNLYEYCGNNPITRVDPSGLKSAPAQRGTLSDEAVEQVPPEWRETFNSLTPKEIERWKQGDLWLYRPPGGGAVQNLTKKQIDAQIRKDLKSGVDVNRKRLGPKQKKPPPSKEGTGAITAPRTPSKTNEVGTGSESSKNKTGAESNTEAKGADQKTGDDTGRSSSRNPGNGTQGKDSNGDGEQGQGQEKGTGGQGTEGAGEGEGRGRGKEGEGPEGQGGGGGDERAPPAGERESEGLDEQGSETLSTTPDVGVEGEGEGTGDTTQGAGRPEGTNLAGGGGGGDTQNGSDGGAGQPGATGRQPGAGGQGRGNGGRGGSGGDKGTGDVSEIDTLVKIAAVTQLEFERSEDGEKYGIPGGMGSHSPGLGGQLLFSVVAIVTAVLGAAKLIANIVKNGLRATLKKALKQLKRFVPAAKKLLKKAKRVVRNAARAVVRGVQRRWRNFWRAGSGGPVGFGRRVLRFFLEDRQTFGMNGDFFGRWRFIFGNNHSWSLEHMLIKQRWYRGANPWFPPGTWANRALQRLGDAGWNVVPIPQSVNGWLFRHKWISGALNWGFYPSSAVGIGAMWKKAWDWGEDIADGRSRNQESQTTAQERKQE